MEIFRFFKFFAVFPLCGGWYLLLLTLLLQPPLPHADASTESREGSRHELRQDADGSKLQFQMMVGQQRIRGRVADFSSSMETDFAAFEQAQLSWRASCSNARLDQNSSAQLGALLLLWCQSANVRAHFKSHTISKISGTRYRVKGILRALQKAYPYAFEVDLLSFSREQTKLRLRMGGVLASGIVPIANRAPVSGSIGGIVSLK